MTDTPIRLYNTRTRAKAPFEPIDAANVRMYVCGPTVYDRAHIGNARPVVVFDVLYRLLRHVYGEEHVTYVRNVTDVDDKINARAEAEKRPIREITDETLAAFHADMGALGVLPPTHEPRATEFIGEPDDARGMIGMIKTLIARRHAYEREGHVLFKVGSYPEYGRFAHRSLNEMRAGARVEVARYKDDPMDFVLWKPSSAAEPGWPSPWGHGRPGWHIECSAMSHDLLGPSFDIHGGGIDLVFPHHENEIAQSKCAHPEGSFANVWMHNGFLNVEGEKMSKSLGNFSTVRDLLDQGVPGEVIRFVLLSTHYRDPMDWTAKRVEEASFTLEKWRTLIAAGGQKGTLSPRVVQLLCNDLKTPQVIAELNELAADGNSADLWASAEILGLLTEEQGHWFQFGSRSLINDPRVQALLQLRSQLRVLKQYKEADDIREKLAGAGIAVMDFRENSAAIQEFKFLVRSQVSKVYKLADDGRIEESRRLAEYLIGFGINFKFVDGVPDIYSASWHHRWLAAASEHVRQIAAEYDVVA